MFSPVRTILKKEYKKEPYSFSHLPSSNAFLLLKEIEYHSWPNSKTEWLKTSSPFPAYPSRKRGLVLALKSLFFSSLAHKRRLTISSSKLLSASSRRNERTRWGEASGFKSLPYALRGRPSQIHSQGSINPLKLVQIVVTVFVPAFNETFLAASACKTLSPSPGKGERTKYQTIWVG